MLAEGLGDGCGDDGSRSARDEDAGHDLMISLPDDISEC